VHVYARTFSLSAVGLCRKPLLERTTLGDFRPPVHVAPLAALSGNECLSFSLRLWFSNDVCSSPNSSRTRVWFLVLQEFGALQVTKGKDSWLRDTKNLVLICLYRLKCTKFDQLILRKIIKIVATRCQILRLKCTKFDFRCGSAPDLAGELTVLSRPPGSKGPTSKGGREMRGRK